MAPPEKESSAASAGSDLDRPADGKVHRASALSARLIYEVILRDGGEELSRPAASLVWSALAAGILISLSVLGEAILRANLPEAEWRYLIENFGYSLGFLAVILGRMQLFTENTITTVLPVMHAPYPGCVRRMLRLWAIVLAGNVVGASVAAWFLSLDPVLADDIRLAVAELSAHATGMGPEQSFLRAIPAGILVAAIVWMMPSASGSGFAIIVTFTWLIAAGDFTHVVAGSVELAYMVLTTDLGVGAAATGFFLPVFAGNVIGGTAVFTLLAWGQVRREVEEEEEESGRSRNAASARA